MEIKVFGDDLNKAVKILKKKLQQDGLYRELRNRRFYEKPSARKRRKAKEAEKRLRKKQRRMQRR